MDLFHFNIKSPGKLKLESLVQSAWLLSRRD